jgi:hypothetical protein
MSLAKRKSEKETNNTRRNLILLVAICLFCPFGFAQENIPAELLPVLQYMLKRSSTCRSLSVRTPTEKSISRLAYEIFILAPVFRRASL